MADSPTTLRRIFTHPENGDPDASPDQWQEFQERISKEVKGIKWPVAMPDLAAKIGELFDIEIPDILVASWKKAKEVQTILDESRRTPEAEMYLELAEHTVTSEHHPYMEVRIKNSPVKKIELTVRLLFKLKGFILKIQEGLIKEMQTGKCEVRGTVEYDGLTIAEKKLEPIRLPGLIPIHISGT